MFQANAEMASCISTANVQKCISRSLAERRSDLRSVAESDSRDDAVQSMLSAFHRIHEPRE